MPQLGQGNKSADKLARLMLYGREKTRKTMWALTAADAGFNVLLIDGDDGAHIASQFKEAALKRVALINVHDSPTEFNFVKFVTHFVTGRPFAFNETTRKLATKPDDNPGWFVMQQGAKALTAHDVVVIDSWTALTASMRLQYSLSNGINLADAEKTDWPGYGWMQNLTTHLLNSMHGLPCHVIIIAHEQQYDKYTGVGKDRKIEWSRTQPLAASGNTGAQLGKHFSDIIRFIGQRPTSSTLEMFGTQFQVGGSRFLKPQKVAFEGPDKPFGGDGNFAFADYAKAAGFTADKDYVSPYEFK